MRHVAPHARSAATEKGSDHTNVDQRIVRLRWKARQCEVKALLGILADADRLTFA
jgi:hypothetical protein